MTGYEITFISNCDLCGERDVQCRNHHLIPQRLLNILPLNRKKRWQHMKVVACTKCNGYLHPENKLYRTIEDLRSKLKEVHDGQA